MRVLETSTFYLYLRYLNVLYEHIAIYVFFLICCIQDQSDFFTDTNTYYGQVYLVEVENLF